MNRGFRVVRVASLLLALVIAGCAHQHRLIAGDVVSIPNADVAALNADDTVVVMRRAGFSDDQILRYGPKLRNDLAAAGGCRIMIRNLVESIFAVHGEDLYVSTRGRGTFRYHLADHAFR